MANARADHRLPSNDQFRRIRRRSAMSDRTIVHATFTLERLYAAAPALVCDAWADPKKKARWFGGGAAGYEMDFRPGGLERNSGTHDAKVITWESLYREIVTDERIVYTSVLAE